MNHQHRLGRVVVGALAVGLGIECSCRADFMGVLELGSPRVVGEYAEMDVQLQFSADAGEALVFFSIDVAASDDGFTANGSDYSAFSFELDTALSGNWAQIPGTEFGLGATQSAIEFDTLMDGLASEAYLLGTLRIKLGGVMLPGTVSVEASNSVIGAEVPGMPQTFSFADVVFNPGSQLIVPEPETFGLVLLGLVVGFWRHAGGMWRVRR